MSRKFPLILSLFSLVCAAALASCSPKLTQEAGTVPLSPDQEEISIMDRGGSDDLSAYKNDTENDNNDDIAATAPPEEIKVELTDPVIKELPDGTSLIATETPQPESGDHWAIPELAPADTQTTDNQVSPTEEIEQWIQNECRDYFDKLNSDPEANAGKIACLKAAEEIINPTDARNELSKPMDTSSWQVVLNKALNLDQNEVLTYTVFGNNDILTWDVAVISIFKLGFRINAFDIRDATSDEIESARSVINGFDTAMDISKFAQMHSSGLLNGLYEKPGFAPGNAVTKGEALLLVKRIVEHIP